MKLVDPLRDSVLGHWRFENGVLVSPVIKGQAARLQIPFTPPDEYVLKMEVERVSNRETLVLGLVAGGRQAMVSLDGWGSTASGLNLDGKEANNNSTTRLGPVFTNGEPSIVTAAVRRHSITINVDGRTIVDWTGDPSSLWVEPGWVVPRIDQLFVRTWESTYRFRRLELAPISEPEPDSQLVLPDGPPGQVRQFNLKPGLKGVPAGLAFHGRGSRIVATTGEALHVWDVSASRLINELQIGEAGGRMALSPDGQSLVTADREQLSVWDVDSFERIRRFEARHTELIHDVAYSPDGRLVASASHDGSAILWNPETGRAVHHLVPAADKVHDVAFAPDGRRVLTADSEGTVRIFDVESADEIRSLKIYGRAQITAMAVSPDGRQALFSNYGGTIDLWDLASGQRLRQLRGHEAGVRCLAYSPDGRRAASGSEDYTVRLWDIESGEELYVFRGHRDIVREVCFSPDGHILASASGGDKPDRRTGRLTSGDDHSARVWRLPSGDATPAGSAQTKPPATATVARRSGAHTAEIQAIGSVETVTPEPGGLEHELSLADAYSVLPAADGEPDEFNRRLQGIARSLPLLEVGTDQDRVVWNRLPLRRTGASLAAYRFKSPLDQSANMYWIFSAPVSELNQAVQSWYIVPREGTMEGFRRYDIEYNVIFSGTRLPTKNATVFQALTGGRILPGEEYIVWFELPRSARESNQSFGESDTLDALHTAIHLEPAAIAIPNSINPASIAKKIGMSFARRTFDLPPTVRSKSDSSPLPSAVD